MKRRHRRYQPAEARRRPPVAAASMEGVRRLHLKIGYGDLSCSMSVLPLTDQREHIGGVMRRILVFARPKRAGVFEAL